MVDVMASIRARVVSWREGAEGGCIAWRVERIAAWLGERREGEMVWLFGKGADGRS